METTSMGCGEPVVYASSGNTGVNCADRVCTIGTFTGTIIPHFPVVDRFNEEENDVTDMDEHLFGRQMLPV